MPTQTCLVPLCIALLARVASSAPIAINSTSTSIQYSPAGAWEAIGAPGAYEGSAVFLLAMREKGIVSFTFPQSAVSFELYGYQRSDGGIYSISIDGGLTVQIDVFNRTATDKDAPVLLYSTTSLSNTVHKVNITNILDTRTGTFGQMNIDHIILDGPPPATPGSVTYVVEANNPNINYSPSGSWRNVKADGSFDSHAMFLVNKFAEGAINYTFSHPATAFEVHGYQRSDGGMFSVSFDGGSPSQIDVYNKTAEGTDLPMLLFAQTGLSNHVHTVTITNLLDSRVGKYGQMNLDHFVLTGIPPTPPSVSAPTFPIDSFIVTQGLEANYHVNVTLGGDVKSNRGDGVPSKVLFDTGAGGVWVVWSGCTEQQCAGHHAYTPSSQHFFNLSKQDTVFYGSGGPANEMSTWRINDTVAFGDTTIDSTTFGAAFAIPSQGEGLDGNFGMARSYCEGVLCVGYANFIENMFEQGIISAPVLAFYQLTDSDDHIDGVVSEIAIGGLDRNKFVGSMDWIPLTNDSMWISPGNARYASAGDGTPTQDLTSQFARTQLTFDTGDPGLLGLPTEDWKTLMAAIGARGPDSGGNSQFPCNSTMTWNFHGTQGRNYTFNLADITSDDGSGFCKPLANDAGDTTNWITGTPFFDQYYTAWYFGRRGVGSTLGLGIKNLEASAATSMPVLGSA